MKACTKCGETKALGEFHRNKLSDDGLCGTCKVCAKERANLHYRENRSKVLARHARRTKEDPEFNRNRYEKYREAHAARYRSRSPEQHEASNIASLAAIYEISTDAVNDLRSRNCALCDSPPRERPHHSHHIDHEHGKRGPDSIRGTLCFMCNVALGCLEKDLPRRGWTDDPSWCASAKGYLDRYAEKRKVTR